MSNIEYVDKTIKVASFKDHVQKKSMWLGSKDPTINEFYLYQDNKFEKSKVIITPSRFKCYEEIIANAFDHFLECLPLNHSVKNIIVNYDGNIFSVMNDGPGFAITYNQEHKKFSVELALCTHLAGSNVDKNEINTVGTNGVGASCVIAHSKFFRVETFDSRCGFAYSQQFDNCLDIINPPIIKTLDGKIVNETNFDQLKTCNPEYIKCDGTKITFELDNNLFKDKGILDLFIKSKLALSALFAQEHAKIFGKTVNIIFNGEVLQPNFNQFPIDCMEKITIKEENNSIDIANKIQENGKHIINDYLTVCIGLNRLDKKEKLQQVTIINSMDICNGGDHLKHFQSLLRNACKEELQQIQEKNGLKCNYGQLYNKLFIITCGHITNPALKGQTKDYINFTKTKLSKFKLPEGFLNSFWSSIKMNIQKSIISSRISKKNTGKGKKIQVEKYDPATCKDKTQRLLFIVEGDSAENLVRDGFIHSNISRDRAGIFSIQGVPMNVRKKIDKFLVNGKEEIVPKEAFLENKRFQALMTALNLKLKNHYDFTEEGEKQYKELEYQGQIIICCDQDIDGLGAIAGLLINFFLVFFPNIVKRGLLSYMRTPLIRAYDLKSKNKSEFINFYSEHEFKIWYNQSQLESSENDKSRFDFVYYKGLASHADGLETAEIFINFKKNVIRLIWDDECQKNAEAYYGKDTELRKKLLLEKFSIPEEYYEKLNKSSITISEHLNIESRNFQRSLLSRKLKCIYDGFVPSQRKVLYYAFKKFGRNNKAIRVSDLASGTVEPTLYEHGESSLCGAISRMAQQFIGSNTIPLLIGLGKFSNRGLGRNASHSGAPRYTKVRLNSKITDLLFPKIDLQLIPSVYQEGKRCEPLYLCPILPMSIIDSSTTPSCGWKVDTLGRDIGKVINSLKLMISGMTPANMLGKPQITDLMSVSITSGNREVYFGNIENVSSDNRTVVINELPLQIWYQDYKANLLDKEFVKTVDISKCHDDKIHIEVKLDNQHELVKLADSDDKLIDLLELKKTVKQLLNMTDEHGNILIFDSYTEAMQMWFERRKELYIKRIDRMLVLARLKLLMLENKLKFINLKLILRGMKKADAEKILEENKIIRFDTKLLTSCDLPTEELEKHILNGNYDYCFKTTKSSELDENIQKLIEKIENQKNTVKELETTTYKRIWLEELAELEKVIDLGLKTNWTFGSNPRFN